MNKYFTSPERTESLENSVADISTGRSQTSILMFTGFFLYKRKNISNLVAVNSNSKFS